MVLPVPISVPVLFTQSEARGKRFSAGTRLRALAHVSQNFPSLGSIDMITPKASPFELVHMNVHSTWVWISCSSSSGVRPQSLRSS